MGGCYRGVTGQGGREGTPADGVLSGQGRLGARVAPSRGEPASRYARSCAREVQMPNTRPLRRLTRRGRSIAARGLAALVALGAGTVIPLPAGAAAGGRDHRNVYR